MYLRVSSATDRSRGSSSSQGGGGGGGRRERAAGNTRKTSSTADSEEGAPETPTVKMVPAPPPKENIWEKRKSEVKGSVAVVAVTTSSTAVDVAAYLPDEKLSASQLVG